MRIAFKSKTLYFLLIGMLSVYISQAQTRTTSKIQADSVRMYQTVGSSELILENSTRHKTAGYLQNWYNGRTRFSYVLDSAWFSNGLLRFRYGKDTLSFNLASAHTHSGLAPAGGTTGQVLKKASNSDYDLFWQNDGGGSSLDSSINGGYYPFASNPKGYLRLSDSLLYTTRLRSQKLIDSLKASLVSALALKVSYTDTAGMFAGYKYWATAHSNPAWLASIDASKITTGTINVNRLPDVDFNISSKLSGSPTSVISPLTVNEANFSGIPLSAISTSGALTGYTPTYNGTTTVWAPGGGGTVGTPPGNDGEVIFNNAGAYGALGQLRWYNAPFAHFQLTGTLVMRSGNSQVFNNPTNTADAGIGLDEFNNFRLSNPNGNVTLRSLFNDIDFMGHNGTAYESRFKVLQNGQLKIGQQPTASAGSYRLITWNDGNVESIDPSVLGGGIDSAFVRMVSINDSTVRFYRFNGTFQDLVRPCPPGTGTAFTETAQEFTGSTSNVKTLTNTPIAGSVQADLNGILYTPSNVSVVGTTVTLSGIALTITDVVTIRYRH